MLLRLKVGKIYARNCFQFYLKHYVIILSSQSASAAAPLSHFFLPFYFLKKPSWARRLKLYSNIGFISLHNLTGNGVISYFRPAAKKCFYVNHHSQLLLTYCLMLFAKGGAMGLAVNRHLMRRSCPRIPWWPPRGVPSPLPAIVTLQYFQILFWVKLNRL